MIRSCVSALLLALLVPVVAQAAVDVREVGELMNESRKEAGLPMLVENALLRKAAEQKAVDLIEGGYYAHVSPEGKTPLYWLDRVGYRYQNAGENLDVNASSAKSAQRAWMNSPEHRANILRASFSEYGAATLDGMYHGKESTYVVVMFGTPLPVVAPIVTPSKSKIVPAVPTPVSQLRSKVEQAVKPIVEAAGLDAFSSSTRAIVAPELDLPATTTFATSTPLSSVVINPVLVLSPVLPVQETNATSWWGGLYSFVFQLRSLIPL